jgi:ribonuclease Z
MCSISLTWNPPEAAGKGAPQPSKPEECDDGERELEDGDEFHPLPFCQTSPFFELVGPFGLAEYLRTTFRVSEAGFLFQYRVTELLPLGMASPPPVSSPIPSEAAPQYIAADPITKSYDLGDLNGIKVKAVILSHRVHCVGYVVTEPDAPGALDMAAAKALGIPKGPLLGKLKNGETVSFTLPEGKEVTVKPSQVVGPTVRGRTCLILGDTCDSKDVLPIAKGASWVVHEATFDEAHSHLAVPRGHSTPKMAGEFAEALQAQCLILTHFSARFPPASKDPAPMAQIAREAKAVFSGSVELAEDFKTFDFSRKRSEGSGPKEGKSAP